MRYKVLGYAGAEPVEIHEAVSLQETIDWLNRYTRGGDWGGYDEFVIKNENGTVEVQFVREEE